MDQNDLSSINIEKLENFELIWLNKMFHYTDKYFEAKLQLQHITSYLKPFFDVNDCFDYIINSDIDHIILLISIDSFDESNILNKANELIQITFLYVITSSLSLNNDVFLNNNRAVLVNEQDLLVKLIDDVRYCTENMTKFNIFTSPIESGKSSKDLTKQAAKFMWFQYILEILLCVPEQNAAKQELIEFCRSCYVNNQTEQDKITDFELNYRSDKAIKWYTRDSFLFRIINKVLRAENIDCIYKLRYILADIYTQLLELHCDYLQCLLDLELFPYVLKVYRGQLMSVRELDQLRRNTGHYISMNTFLSTSSDREVSVMFSGEGARRPQLESVLFEIEIQTDTCSLPYADIQKSSWNPGEEEILLALGAIFRIDSVESQDNIWIIKLSLYNQDSTGVQDAHNFLPDRKRHEQLSINDFAKCLDQLGESHLAAQIYANQLQSHLSLSGLDRAILLYSFANCNMTCNYIDPNGLLKCYQMCVKLVPRPILPMFPQLGIKAASLLMDHGEYKMAHTLIIKTISMIVNEFDGTFSDEARRLKMLSLADLYNTLGVYHTYQYQYEDALDYFQSTIRIYKGHLRSNSNEFGRIYSNLAKLHYNQGKYSDAIEYMKKAISIYSQSLPSDHPDLADCYHDLGISYAENGELVKACEAIGVALEKRLKAETVNHVLVGMSYLHLGHLFAKIDYNTQALFYYFKTEEIWRQYLPESHLLFRHLYTAIGRVYGHAKADLMTARSFLDKALLIETNCLKRNSQDVSIFLGDINSNLGENYYHCGKYEEALIYYEKAFKIFQCTLPNTHLVFVCLYNNIALTHQGLGNQDVTITYYERSIDIIHSQESVSLKNDLLADAYGNIGTLHLDNGSCKKAIEYFEKQLTTKKLNIVTCQSPYFITTYTGLGSAYTSLNKCTEALEYHHRALDIAQAILPTYHEILGNIYNNIACVYSEQAKYDQALHYLKLSLQVKLNCKPSDHPTIATAYYNLACVYASKLDNDESINAAESAVAILKQCPPNTFPGLANVYTRLGSSYCRLNQLDRAEDYLQQSITLLRSMYKIQDDNHYKFAFTYDIFALVKCAQGSFEEAEYLCQKSFNLLLTELPSDSVNVGLSYETFGIIYNARKKYEQALTFFYKSETIIRRVSDEHPFLVRIFREMGSVFYNQRIYDRALEFYTKAIDLALKVYETNTKLINSLTYDLDRVMDNILSIE
ncbi:unnamed protein product [Rotaria sordida]|uniref:Uncharacterized protein n=1 Tax=Rotaria sordida TaxID=392033 RepID=A0A815H7Q0_9BILA|nr:unnamed protein product [Rotaria sordida]